MKIVAWVCAFAAVWLATAPAQADNRRAYCKRLATNYANSQTAGAVAGGAVGGAVLGLGIGALAGGRNALGAGAAIGAGVGAAGGAMQGSAAWRQNYWGRYNDCMAGY